MNNCENSLSSNNVLNEITILFGQDGTNNNKNNKFEITYKTNQDNQSNQDIIVYEPNKTPKFVDKDIFLEKGLILYNEGCRLKPCKTWDSGICKRTSSLFRFRKHFENTLISLRNKRNNKYLKRLILKRLIDNSLQVINNFTNNLNQISEGNQIGGDVSLVAIIVLIPFIGFCLSMYCKLFTKKPDCWKYFKYSIFILYIIAFIICSFIFNDCSSSGWWVTSTGTNRNKRNKIGGSNNKINFKDIIKLLKQKIDKENISMNTHYFQIKNINKISNKTDESKYFLQVKIEKFSKKVKICQIIRVKNLDILKPQNNPLDIDFYMNKLESIKDKIVEIVKEKKLNKNQMQKLQNEINKISYEAEKNAEKIIVNEEQKEPKE